MSKITLFAVAQSFPESLAIRFCRVVEGNNLQVYAVSAMEMYAAKADAFSVIKAYLENLEPDIEVVRNPLQTVTCYPKNLENEIFVSMFEKGMELVREGYLQAREQLPPNNPPICGEVPNLRLF